MSKRYSRKSKRSSRRRVYQAEVLSIGTDGPARSVAVPLPAEAFLGDLRESIKDFAGQAGLQLMLTLIEQEVVDQVGQRHQRDPQRQASRWGRETGYVVWSGRKVAVKRPRVRDRAGQELPLARYQQFQQDGPLQREVADRVLAGVSMRKYEQAVDELCQGYGISKSSVSRQWRAASAESMRQLCERRLEELDLAVLMIDGIHLGQFLLIAALGIDTSGVKHVLGLWQGATENAEVCSGLLDDLAGRGLRTDVKYLFVLDGAKALSKAVRSRFGSEADIQRCQVHKERNVLEHLPRRYQSVIRRRLRAAWGMKDYAAAKRELEALVKHLDELNPSAGASLTEGLEETLTVHRLGVPATLRTSLRSTNPMENCFSTTRETSAHVKRWRTADQAWRWAGTCLLQAEQRFHRLKGGDSMGVLLASLGRAFDSAKHVG